MKTKAFRFRSILGMLAATALCVSCAQDAIRSEDDVANQVRPIETTVPVAGRSETKGGEVVGNEEAVALLDGLAEKEKNEPPAPPAKIEPDMERALAAVNTAGPQNPTQDDSTKAVELDAKDVEPVVEAQKAPTEQNVSVTSTSAPATSAPAPTPTVTTASNDKPAAKKFLEVEEPAPKRVFHHQNHSVTVEATPTPEISLETRSQEGVLLNRFYFTRLGDTPEKVALLIYADKSKIGDLIQWNADKKNWAPGTILYYSSPAHAEDKQMLPFFQERNVAPREYTVRHGDALPKIAKELYGSGQSWKEIAIMNGLKGSADIRIGQVLSVYPAHFEPAKEVVTQETHPVTPENPTPKPVEKKTTLEADAPITIPTPGNVSTEAPKEIEAKAAAPADAKSDVKPPHLASLEIAKTVESSSSLGIVFAVSVVVLLALFLARRSRRRRRPDFFG